MTKDDITKLPTPEITLIFEKSRFCPSGNKSCWEDYSKLESARPLPRTAPRCGGDGAGNMFASLIDA